MLTDEQIVELYWARNEIAIEKTHQMYGRMLFTIAYNILHNTSDCEECRNDTYLSVWNSIPPTRPSIFAAFISKIMRNTAIDRYKERSRQKRIPSEMTVVIEDLENTLSDNTTPEKEFLTMEIAQAINGFLGMLNEQDRYMFIGRFYFAQSLDFLAEELSVNTSTVCRRINKLKQRLKDHLAKEGVYV